mmetsp:Transcript_70955/g.201326  ORF Transcript_70955/g.201326 Transcript_70955/m.201326 type:complete len:277 (-) Transcript_70955:965-1795(-)
MDGAASTGSRPPARDCRTRGGPRCGPGGSSSAALGKGKRRRRIEEEGGRHEEEAESHEAGRRRGQLSPLPQGLERQRQHARAPEATLVQQRGQPGILPLHGIESVPGQDPSHDLPVAGSRRVVVRLPQVEVDLAHQRPRLAGELAAEPTAVHGRLALHAAVHDEQHPVEIPRVALEDGLPGLEARDSHPPCQLLEHGWGDAIGRVSVLAQYPQEQLQLRLLRAAAVQALGQAQAARWMLLPQRPPLAPGQGVVEAVGDLAAAYLDVLFRREGHILF